MIVEMPATTTHEISKRLVSERNQWGAVALGRVLTLIIDAGSGDPEPAIAAANLASLQNPCRVLVLSATSHDAGRLDAELRFGSDAGAGEVIVLRHSDQEAPNLDTLVLPLLLPDAPVVAWWSNGAPANPGATRVGGLARRRITSSQSCENPRQALLDLAANYTPGDTDLAWTRTTVWRSLLAAALDQSPLEPVERVVVTGEKGHPSVDLIAAWLGSKLGCPSDVVRLEGAPALTEVRLERPSGAIVFSRPDGKVATLSRPGIPPQTIPLPIRGLDEAVAEELRQLGEDAVYGDVLQAFATMNSIEE